MPLTCEPLKLMAVVAVVLQRVWLLTVFTVGVGFTMILKLAGLPVQPLAVGVTVI